MERLRFQRLRGTRPREAASGENRFRDTLCGPANAGEDQLVSLFRERDSGGPRSAQPRLAEEALEKIVRRIRDNSVGREGYSRIDFVEDVKCACAREGVAFDHDLFNELIR